MFAKSTLYELGPGIWFFDFAYKLKKSFFLSFEKVITVFDRLFDEILSKDLEVS